MDLMKAFTEKYTKAEPPKVSIGDTVRVHLRVKEGSPYPEVFPPVLPSPPSRILPAPSSILTGNTCGIPIPRR